MNNKDLVVGDWVLCNGTPMKLNIGQIHNLVCETKWARTHKCEPVPLTEDILKANGFVFDNVEYEYVLEGFPSVIIDVHSAFFSVHQLQHALRLCGLNDFADNFKIQQL